jgi:hypothetical protein
MKIKPYFLRCDTQVVVQTGHVHTQDVLLVGHIHMHVSLPIGHVLVERLISIEDCFLISVGTEGVSCVLHYRAGVLVELYSIQLLLITQGL